MVSISPAMLGRAKVRMIVKDAIKRRMWDIRFLLFKLVEFVSQVGRPQEVTSKNACNPLSKLAHMAS